MRRAEVISRATKEVMELGGSGDGQFVGACRAWITTRATGLVRLSWDDRIRGLKPAKIVSSHGGFGGKARKLEQADGTETCSSCARGRDAEDERFLRSRERRQGPANVESGDRKEVAINRVCQCLEETNSMRGAARVVVNNGGSVNAASRG